MTHLISTAAASCNLHSVPHKLLSTSTPFVGSRGDKFKGVLALVCAAAPCCVAHSDLLCANTTICMQFAVGDLLLMMADRH